MADFTLRTTADN